MPTAPTLKPGWVPFGVLALLGKAPDDLPGRWEPWPVPPSAPPGAERYRYTAWGKEDGRDVPIEIVVHVVGGHVEAVAFASPAHLGEVEYPPNGEPFLVAVQRPRRRDPRLLAWIGRQATRYLNLGLAY